MSESAKVEEVTTDLLGIPGLGPVRRRLLNEAGIQHRSEFLQTDLEQIVSITGMPRAVAEQVIAFVRANTSPLSLETVQTVEEFVEAPGELLSDDEPATISLGEDKLQTTRLEKAAQQAQRVIADASRRVEPGSKLSEKLLRFARLTDKLPLQVTPDTRAGIVKRITERIEAITERLQVLVPEKGKRNPLGSKRTKRLEQRLNRTRDSIKRTLKTSASN